MDVSRKKNKFYSIDLQKKYYFCKDIRKYINKNITYGNQKIRKR